MSRYTTTSVFFPLLSVALRLGRDPDATLRFVMFQAPMPERDAQAVRLCTDVKYDDLLRGFRRGKARDSHYRDAISRLKYKKMWLMSW